MKAIAGYFLLAVVLFVTMMVLPFDGIANIVVRTLLLFVYAAVFCFRELPLARLLKKSKQV